jgi:hypothetical protein
MMDESRLDYLEGRVEEQARNWERLFADIGRVDQKIDAFAVALSTRIDANWERLLAEVARVDQTIDALSARLDTRCDALDQKLDLKIDGLRGELSTQFRWTIGIMTGLFTAVLAAILTR